MGLNRYMFSITIRETVMKNHLTLLAWLFPRQDIKNVRILRKGNPYTLWVGILIGAATVQNTMISQKLANRRTVGSSNPTSGYIFIGNEIWISKRYPLSDVHCSVTHDSQYMETT